MRENLPEVLPPFPTTIVPTRKKSKPKQRNISPVLRAAANHIDRYGFTIHFGGRYRPACFLGSIETAIESGIGSQNKSYLDIYGKRDQILKFLQKIIFSHHPNFTDEEYLERHGWNQKDAVAALTIAADIAEVQGR